MKMKLSEVQQKSLDYRKISVIQSIESLTSKITNNVIPTLINLNIIKLQAMDGEIKDRHTIAQILRESSKEWTRDWDRVAHTEIWNAKLTGEVMTILEKNSPVSNKHGDTLVYKKPSPMACDQCKRLYLKSDMKTPKIFKLSELMSNGTNIGLKTSEWKPVYGTIHPNCMCPLSILPDGFTFDKDGEVVPIE